MLHVLKHWHNAFQQAPYREARLLAFAKSPGTPADPDPAPEADPTQNTETFAGAGRNPDGTPITPTSTPKPEETTKATTDKTRAAVAETLGSGGAADKKEKKEVLGIKEVAEKLKAMRTRIHVLTNLRKGRPDIGEALRALPADTQKDIDTAVHAIDEQYTASIELDYQADTLATWKEGNLKPKFLRAKLKDSFRNHPDIDSILQSYDTAMQDPEIAQKAKEWNEGIEQESDKILVVQHVWKAIDGDRLTQELQNYTELWNDYVDKIDKTFQEASKPGDEYAKKMKDDEAVIIRSKGIMQHINDVRINGVMGIGLYTPREYMDAFTKVWTAFQDARKEATEQQSNKLAAAFGNTIQSAHLPYGEAINRRLVSTLESQFNKAKNEFKEELGDDNFATLVDKFQDVRNDPPKAIAVLEAAAGHGWLYDISDLEVERSVEDVEIFGVKYLSVVPDHWDANQRENYLSTLTRSNNSGQKEERGKGADRVREQVKPEVFKKRFEAALDAQNYWSAIGIAETFIDRGKLGEVSEYLTLTMIDHLRNNPSARKYMTRPVLEQFGIMGNKWGTANFATTNIVFHVDTVYKLKQNPDQMDGPFLGIIEKLQNDVIAAAGGPSALSRSDVISKSSELLAGKTVTVNGNVLSIFDEKYRAYWDESKNTMFGTFEGKQALSTAPDYYQQDASVLLLPKTSIMAILKTGSTGTFDSPEFAQNLAGQAIKRVEELNKLNPKAAEVFRTEMGRKLKAGLNQAFTGQAPKQLGKYPWKRANEEGEPMIADLISHGFMTYEDVVGYAKGHQGADEFAKELKEQVNNIARPRKHENDPSDPSAGAAPAPHYNVAA